MYFFEDYLKISPLHGTWTPSYLSYVFSANFFYIEDETLSAPSLPRPRARVRRGLFPTLK